MKAREVGVVSIETALQEAGWTPAQAAALSADVQGRGLDLDLLTDAVTIAFARRGPAAPLSREQEEFLLAHSGLGQPTETVEQARVAHARERLQAVVQALSTAWSVDEVATHLGVSGETVRHRVSARRLHAYRADHTLYLPRWQFTHEGGLPRLRPVLRALPQDMDPLAIDAFFTTPDDDLAGQTAAQWLSAGGQANPVMLAAQTLSAW